MKTRLAFKALGVALALGACALSPGGPEYAEIGLRTLDSSGQELSRECLPLPVLPGGVVEKDVALAPGLDAHVLAMRDSAEVTLRGTDDPVSGHVVVTQPTLLRGYTNTLAVTTLEGGTYSVVLFAPCSTPAASSP